MKRLVVILALVVVGYADAAPVVVLPRPSFPAPATGPGAGANTVHFQIVSSAPIDPAQPIPSPKPLGGARIEGPDGNTQHIVVTLGEPFDFKNFAWPPRIAPGERPYGYEQVVYANRSAAGTLFVETAHQTYAKSSYGLNGYLNAVGPRQRQLLWRSPAQVANARNFVILNHTVITGYGFTAEPDYLYALDAFTGKVEGRLLLPSAPQVIARHGNELTVTTYDHRVAVRVTGA